MNSLVVLQARTGSSRLPAKALLPVAQYPTAVLAALRARNSGLSVVVATTIDSSDDRLAETLEDFGLPVVRGPTDDVLSRYILAVNGLPDDIAIVRLTADNVLPDGSLVEELLGALAQSSNEYVAQSYPQSGLPYGLGGEAFTVAALRLAHENAITPHDREHVTPWMIRNCRCAIARPQALGEVDYSYLRCSIDDEEDYQRILRLFENVTDPISISWRDLMMKLSTFPGEPLFRVPYKMVQGSLHSEFTLGTAQLGMKYGIANQTGRPDRELAVKMIRRSIAHGVTAIDTARGYGTAEEIIGEAFAGAWRSRARVITKLSALDALDKDASGLEIRAAVEGSVNQSREALGAIKIDTLLLHRARHHGDWRGAAWDHLLRLKGEGKIGKLGASVYSPDEAIDLLRDAEVEHLQIPFNVLDWRWNSEELKFALQNRPDVVIHVRSALLQGILTMSASPWTQIPCYDFDGVLDDLRRLAIAFGRDGVVDLCLAYVRSQAWVSSVVVGCELLEQLDENLRLFSLPKMLPEQCRELESLLPKAPETLLNPSLWNLAYEQNRN